MRRNDREVKDFNEIIKIMEKCDICRVALFDEEYPYVLPLNFGMQVVEDKITLYFHGALEGKKYDLMRKNNKVGFEMDCSYQFVVKENHSYTAAYESVMGNGILEFVAEEDKYEALCILMQHYMKEGYEINRDVIPKTMLFKLTVNTVTGKANQIKK